MGTFDLKSAEQVRMSITTKQAKEIRQLYNEIYKDVTKQIQRLGKTNIQTQNLFLLKRDINNRIKQITKQIESGIITDMRIVAEEVVKDKQKYLLQCGFKKEDIHEAFMYIPDQIVRNIQTGNVYQNGWTLSEAIWGHTKQTQDTINNIIAKGTAQGKSALDIAKDLEQYVQPSQQKASRRIQFINPKTGLKDTFYFGNVDYNAQRLARTLISHAYQQSFRNVNENDPFVKDYIWHSAMQHGRTCQICMDRNGKHFKKNELPEDHPNGLCTYEANIPDSMSDIAKKIGMWYQSPTGTYPDIDRYALDFLK